MVFELARSQLRLAGSFDALLAGGRPRPQIERIALPGMKEKVRYPCSKIAIVSRGIQEHHPARGHGALRSGSEAQARIGLGRRLPGAEQVR
jgi:hypothetical protein